METMVYRRTNEATEAMRRLNAAKKHLQDGNLFSSIVALRDVLEILPNLHNVQEKDQKRLTDAINDFLRVLAVSQEFNDLYGKVYFRDDDFSTSYDFLCQLIRIKEEEVAEVLVNETVTGMLQLSTLGEEDQKTARLMVSLVERGEVSALRDLVAANESVGSLVLAFYNETGIGHRISGNVDKAILEYKKALSIAPGDEHLYYNLARAYLALGQKKNAEASIAQAMRINPDFREGVKLTRHIERQPL
jgi:tetratricopeptide (TPR) repeat protein